MHPTPSRTTWTLGAALAGLLAASCAPAGECQGYNDCGAGRICNADRVCIDDPIDTGPPINVNPNLPNDGGPTDGGPGDTLQIRTRFFVVPWIQRDPTNATRILYPDFDSQADLVNTDEVRGFDATSGVVDPIPVFNTFAMTDGECQPDSIIDPGLPTDELWFNCQLGPALRTVYDDDPSKQTENQPSLGSAHFVYATMPTGNEWGRRLFASRGGNLRSVQSRSSDGLGSPHIVDTVTPAIGGVVAIFPLVRESLAGDFALVHDRSNNQLVPVERQLGQEGWGPAGQLDPLDLPDGAHAVWLLDDVHATGATPSAGIANVMTIHPNGGWLRFWNYETANEIFPQTRFEPNANFHAAPPAATERLLLEPTPSGDYLFYTHQSTYRVYRLPLAGGAENDVRMYEYRDVLRRASAIVPHSEDEVWISYGAPANENLIERATVDQQP
jgi:hypothetical protein